MKDWFEQLLVILDKSGLKIIAVIIVGLIFMFIGINFIKTFFIGNPFIEPLAPIFTLLIIIICLIGMIRLIWAIIMKTKKDIDNH